MRGEREQRRRGRRDRLLAHLQIALAPLVRERRLGDATAGDDRHVAGWEVARHEPVGRRDAHAGYRVVRRDHLLHRHVADGEWRGEGLAEAPRSGSGRHHDRLAGHRELKRLVERDAVPRHLAHLDDAASLPGHRGEVGQPRVRESAIVEGEHEHVRTRDGRRRRQRRGRR